MEPQLEHLFSNKMEYFMTKRQRNRDGVGDGEWEWEQQQQTITQNFRASVAAFAVHARLGTRRCRAGQAEADLARLVSSRPDLELDLSLKTQLLLLLLLLLPAACAWWCVWHVAI